MLPTESSTEATRNANAGDIAGGSVAAVVAINISLLIVVLLVCKQRKKRKRRQEAAERYMCTMYICRGMFRLFLVAWMMMHSCWSCDYARVCLSAAQF